MKAKKSLGQHFLMHRQIAERIVAVSDVGGEDTVLEIGPGTGLLTRALLARARSVVAVEADSALVEQLRETFARDIADEKLILVHGDIREYLNEHPVGPAANYRVVANIPYYLTGEILRTLLTAACQPRSMTLLVQKEVAQRVASRHRSGQARAKESLLSLSVRAYGTPKYEFTVPRGAFRPAPNVDSAVLSIRDISRDRFASAREESRFFDLIRAGFSHPRKLVSNNLRNAGYAVSVSPGARAEDLTLSDWLILAKTAS